MIALLIDYIARWLGIEEPPENVSITILHGVRESYDDVLALQGSNEDLQEQE